jgi:regulatory protein
MPPRSAAPADPGPRAAAVAGLVLLSRRELSSSQLKARLLRKGFPETSVEAALRQLRASGALDDVRAARARARHDLVIHRHGRARILRQVRALGVDAEVAREAVASAFDEVDEARLLADAVARRLKGQPPPTDPRAVRRLQAWLFRQGFDADAIRRLFNRRAPTDDDA